MATPHLPHWKGLPFTTRSMYPDSGKDWRQGEKGMTEDEMVGWHHWLNGHEFEQAQEVGNRQGSLACCSSWGCKESDMTEWLNWADWTDTLLVAQTVKKPPAMQETWVWPLGWEDSLEKGMATHSNILLWRIPWTEEFCGLQFMGSQRVGHDWATNPFIFFPLSYICVYVYITELLCCTAGLTQHYKSIILELKNKQTALNTVFFERIKKLLMLMSNYLILHLSSL